VGQRERGEQTVSDVDLLAMVHSQEAAISELTERLRTRDAIMEAAIIESEALAQHLKALHMRMLQARFKRA
jgi:DNA polymerase/3'-5' exonuclease PolX